MQKFSSSPFALTASFWVNRSLIAVMIKREIVGRYQGSMLGILWSFFNPLFMLIVYTFFFGEVFKARWSSEGESKSEFALILFSGLLVYSLFAECVTRSPSLVIANVNYVKKMVFPLEILPIVALLSACFHLVISFFVWLLFFVIFIGTPKLTVLLFPMVLMPLLLFTLGISLILASLGVFLRDVSQVIGVTTTALMFLTPIFYPISVLPAQYQVIMQLNPLTSMIQGVREVLIWGRLPTFSNLAIQFLVSGFIAWVGFAWFQKTRKGFADVL
jgi:lipopolysaccharide transport system permease protein